MKIQKYKRLHIPDFSIELSNWNPTSFQSITSALYITLATSSPQRNSVLTLLYVKMKNYEESNEI